MDISIIELGFYGFVELSTFLMLVIMIVKEVPNTKVESIARTVFAIPGLICAGIMAGTGVNIQTHVASTNDIIKNLNDSSTWQDVSSNTTTVILSSPIWILFHFLIFAAIFVYIIMQIVNLLTKKD